MHGVESESTYILVMMDMDIKAQQIGGGLADCP